MEEERVLVWKTEILFSCSSTYYICWINKRPFPPLVKEKNYLEIQKYFPKCFDKRKNKTEITDSQENYEEQNVSYQIMGNSESYIQKKLYGFKCFTYKRRKRKKKISVHIQQLGKEQINRQQKEKMKRVKLQLMKQISQIENE